MILAGGRGERLKPLTNNLPKVLIPVQGRPFIDYPLEKFHKEGFSKLVFLTGVFSEKVEKHLKKWNGVFDITVKKDARPDLGTGNAIAGAVDFIEKDFLLVYGDSFLQHRLLSVCGLYEKKKALGVLSVWIDMHNEKKDVLVSENGLVLKYEKPRVSADLNGQEMGGNVFSKKVLKSLPEEPFNFEEIVYSNLIRQRQLLAYPTRKRLYDINTMEKLREFESFVLESKLF